MKEADIYETIQHDGIVQKVGDNSVLVTISSSSACSGCHAEGLCSISGKEEKTINVDGKYKVSPGDQVTVLMKQSMGYKAIVLSYLIPVVLVIACLLIMASLGVQELTSGLGSIAILVPYFFLLYLFRRKISKSFMFTLKT
ncbi:MAG: SoxR reducing system RseC family protein [Bacteroidales bacterium]